MGEASVQQAQCGLDGGHKGQTRHLGGNAHAGVDAGFPCIREGDSRLVKTTSCSGLGSQQASLVRRNRDLRKGLVIQGVSRWKINLSFNRSLILRMSRCEALGLVNGESRPRETRVL